MVPGIQYVPGPLLTKKMLFSGYRSPIKKNVMIILGL